MDTKIQKYARRCELAARYLMAVAIVDWTLKWVLDWYCYYCLVWLEHLDTTQYQSLADVLQKFKPADLTWINYTDRILQNSISLSWMGLANLAKLSWQSHVIGFLADGVAVGIMVVGCWFFIKLMRQLTKGSVFSVEAIELLNKIAKVIFCFAIYIPINRMIVDALIVLSNQPGQRIWFPIIGFNDILTLAISWFFVILTSLMRESRELQSERDLTV